MITTRTNKTGNIITDLASYIGAALIGNGGETVADSLNSLQLPNYAALRAYKGPRKMVYVTGYYVTSEISPIAGNFILVSSDTTSADNDGSIIKDALGRCWKRPLSDEMLHVGWFGALPSHHATSSPYTNFTAIRATLAAALTHKVTRLTSQREICFGTGEYLIAGSSPFCFTRTEMLALPGAYRYRRGLKISGKGRQATVLKLFTLGVGPQWFYNSFDPLFPTDSSVMDYLKFDGLTFQGTTAYQVQATPFETNGFHFHTAGWEKFVSFYDCMFESLDEIFTIEGYGNADHNRFFGCQFRAFRKWAFYFNNNQSVAWLLSGCDMEEATGSCFHIGPQGGGDVIWDGGAIVLYPNLLPDGSIDAIQRDKAFVFWDNSGVTSGPSSGSANNQFVFNSLRFETYGPKQHIVFSYRSDVSAYGSLRVTFNGGSWVNPHTYGSNPVSPPTNWNAMSLENDVIVYVNRVQISPFYNFAVVKHSGKIYFDECEYPHETPNSTELLSDNCTVAPETGGLISCRRLHAPQLVTGGDYANLIVSDFTKGRNGRTNSKALVQAKHPLTLWPQIGIAGSVKVYIPSGSVVLAVGIEKPEEYLAAPSADYGLGVLGSAGEVLVPYIAGSANREILIWKQLATPYKVPALPNNFITLASGGSGMVTPFASKDGAFYIEYL